jgi:tRNA threonylcarbamoyl adenosine modification protein YeaZ
LTLLTSSFEARTLVIETATSVCSVALFEENRLIAERNETIGRGHAERLIPMIAELPDGGKAAQIYVGCGPGSFTGIRVGVSAARGLGLGWGASVHGYSTMALIAARAFADTFGLDELGVVQIGGHGELFVQRFARSPFAETMSLHSISLDDAIETLRVEAVAGSAAERFIAARGFGAYVAAPVHAQCALYLPASFLLPPSPLYVRGADAVPMAKQ